MTKERYQIYPIWDSNCDRMDRSSLLESTDSLEQARDRADHWGSDYEYGVAILDSQSREVDWGFGFGESAEEWVSFYLD